MDKEKDENKKGNFMSYLGTGIMILFKLFLILGVIIGLGLLWFIYEYTHAGGRIGGP